MCFVVLCDRKNLNEFKKDKGYRGAIYLIKPDEDFTISIDEIPNDVSKVYFEYKDLYYNFIMNNNDKFGTYEAFSFENEDGRIILGNARLTEKGLDCLRSGDLNLALHFLIRALWLNRHTRDERAISEAETAYTVYLHNEYVKKGEQLLSSGQSGAAAYYFRRALFIKRSNAKAKEGLESAISNLLRSHDSEQKKTEDFEKKVSISCKDSKKSNYAKVDLADLQDITQNEFNLACGVVEKLKKLVQKRETYIDIQNLDKKTNVPRAYWINRSEEAILNPTYDTINHLRLYSNIFTGNKLSFILDPSCVSPPKHEVKRFVGLTKELPQDLIAQPPGKLGEIGWLFNGGILNVDIVAYQERITLLYDSGLVDILRKRPELKILEIGSGYGGLAYFVKRAFPQSSIYLCDIPNSLVFAAVYLPLVAPEVEHAIYDGEDATLLKPKKGFVYLPNYMFHSLQEHQFDLVINTLSFAEMSKEQVSEYAAGITRMIGKTGYLFEQNQDKRIKIKDILSGFFKYRTFIGRGAQGIAHVWANTGGKDLIMFNDRFGKGKLKVKIKDILSRFFKYKMFIGKDAQGIAHVWANTGGKDLKMFNDRFRKGERKLVEEGYRGFNIISCNGELYGLAQGVGKLDLSKVDTEGYRCVIGKSIDDVKGLIDKLLAKSNGGSK